MAIAELERVSEKSLGFSEKDTRHSSAPVVARDGRADSALIKRHAGQLFVLCVVALITRGLWIGDPIIGGDEQFYLLVGDRMWHGAWPYVDIWDRKPIGLFLIYAALRPFSSDGVIAYQIGALVFAVSTAFVVVRIATRRVAPLAATVAGCLYLTLLPVFGGVGGQAPVFYNLFMALAALMVVKAAEVADCQQQRRFALAAMLLAGLAIQVKYTAVVEGSAFGLWLLYLVWRQGRGIAAIAGTACLSVAVALLPTILALAAYVAARHGRAFVFSNFLSIFLKHTPASEVANIAHNAILLGPIVLFAGCAFALSIRRDGPSPLALFLALWSVAAIAGFFVVGHYYTHYALPMLVPLCILGATALENVAGLALALTFAILCYLGTTQFPRTDRMDADHRKIDRMVSVLAPYERHGCIYVNEGPTALYLLTRSCLPTTYVFPEHLTLAAEAPAFDTTHAMAALLAKKPPAIVTRRWTEADLRNVATDRMLAQALAAGYHLKATIPAPKSRDVLDIWGRNDLP